jgi:CRP-like cAMP-binding protein
MLQEKRVLEFVRAFHELYPISEEARQLLADKITIQQFKKGDYLIRSGTECQHLWLIQQGIVRSFIIINDKLMTTWFASEMEFVTAFSSCGHQQPASENIQALEDCIVAQIEIAELELCYKQFPEILMPVIIVLSTWCRHAEQRNVLLRMPQVENRYHHFVKAYDNLFSRINLKVVASFLNISAETISRIRASLVKRRRK